MNTLAAVGASRAVIGPARAASAWAVAARVVKAVGPAIFVTVAALALAVQPATADPKSFTLSNPSSNPVVLTTQLKGLLSQAQKDNIANNLERDKYKGAGYTLLHLPGPNGEELNQVTGLQDCAGYVFSKLWPNATPDPVHLTAANFYRDIIQAFNAPEVGFGGAKPGDVVVYFNVDGQAKHIAYVTAVGVGGLSVTIDTKDEDERIYSTSIDRNFPWGWLTNNTDPLIRNYGAGGVKIFRVDPNSIQVNAITPDQPNQPNQPNVAGGNSSNGNANNANAANNNQPNANNANAGGGAGADNQGAGNQSAGNQGAGNQGAGNQGASGAGGGQQAYDPATNTGGNQSADCVKAQNAVADAQAGLDTATEFIGAALWNLIDAAFGNLHQFGGSNKELTESEIARLYHAAEMLKNQLVPLRKKVDDAKAAAQKICNTPTNTTTATAAPAPAKQPAPPAPPPAPIAVTAPAPPAPPAKPDCTQQGEACMAAQASYAKAAHMIFNWNGAYDLPLPCVAGYSASLQTPLTTPEQRQLLNQWANARDAYLACSRGTSNPTPPASTSASNNASGACTNPTQTRQYLCYYENSVIRAQDANGNCPTVCTDTTTGAPVATIYVNPSTAANYNPLAPQYSGKCPMGSRVASYSGWGYGCTSSSGDSASAAPAAPATPPPQEQAATPIADLGPPPQEQAATQTAGLGPPPQEQAATSMASLGPPPDSPAPPAPAGPSSPGTTAMSTPPVVPAPLNLPAPQPTASYNAGSNICNPAPPAPPKPGNVCNPSGNAGQQTAAPPPQNASPSGVTARVNSGQCNTINGQTTCTDASGNSCTTTAGFCDPAAPQTTKTAAAPTPPAPNAGPLQLKPATQMASVAQPCSQKTQNASVPACSSKPPYLPWGGTGSAVITVSGGKPCGVGWHDTPGGPGGVTVLDSMSVTLSPSHGSLKPQDQHVIIFTPAPGYKGQDAFTLSMQEHNGGRKATLSVKVSVTVQ